MKTIDEMTKSEIMKRYIDIMAEMGRSCCISLSNTDIKIIEYAAMQFNKQEE